MSDNTQIHLAENLLAENLDPYDGRWVAMRSGKVVAHAADEPTVRAHPATRPDDLYFPVGKPVTGFYMLNV
ncbi:MAG TPA: hypothetical protein VG265_12820 [Gaiellaceae bacterium]|jgi:hypothetical protein|nr:hypothetical protein [Gaiellaceae bacterium]